MSRLHFELPCGAAGDMIFGALLDCGADFDYINTTLRRLKLDNWDLGLGDVVRSGITAKKVRVSDLFASDKGDDGLHMNIHMGTLIAIMLRTGI